MFSEDIPEAKRTNSNFGLNFLKQQLDLEHALESQQTAMVLNTSLQWKCNRKARG